MERPKLTQELVDQAIALKADGLSNGDIICALGIHESTFYRRIGDPKNRLQRELSEGLKKEEAAFKQTLLTTIRAAALARNQYWTAAAWLLERKYPDEYGKAERRRDERLVHIARHRARDARQPGRERRGGAPVLQRAARLGLPADDVGDRGAGAGEVVPRAHLPHGAHLRANGAAHRVPRRGWPCEMGLERSTPPGGWGRGAANDAKLGGVECSGD